MFRQYLKMKVFTWDVRSGERKIHWIISNPVVSDSVGHQTCGIRFSRGIKLHGFRFLKVWHQATSDSPMSDNCLRLRGKWYPGPNNLSHNGIESNRTYHLKERLFLNFILNFWIWILDFRGHGRALFPWLLEMHYIFKNGFCKVQTY